MPTPEHIIYEDYTRIDQWELTCSQCFKTISPCRPPVFNPDNCSCAESGTLANGDSKMSMEGFGQQLYHHDSGDDRNQIQSYASSSISVSCPEGPEREVPNFQIGKAFLPLGPDTDLNEIQHCRSSSFHSDMSYQMRRFLVEQDSHKPPFSIAMASTETNFLLQDLHSQSSRATKTKKKSKPSYQSISSGTGETSFSGWTGDPMAGIGTWDDSRGQENCYPMTMSGLSDPTSDD